MRPMRHGSVAGLSLIILTVMAACGIVGPPIAPENVGVNPTITRQKAELKKSGETQELANAPASPSQVAPAEFKGQDDELPPLRPVGTR